MLRKGRVPLRLGTFCVLVVLGNGTALPAWADPPEAKEEKPDFPKLEEVVKDHVESKGFLPLYYNEKDDHLLAVIPKKMVGKNFLMATSIAAGPDYAGWQWGHRVVQWREIGKKLVLVEPDLRYKSGGDSEVADVIRRTYRDRIVLSTPIVTKRGEDPVIDLDKVFKSDVFGLAQVFGGKMDAGLSRWTERKVFVQNVELSLDAAMMQEHGGTLVEVHYSLSELSESDYKPRVADDRIGYFLTAKKDWARPHEDKTLFDRYIHRWRLRKAEPDREVSDVQPDDQIVFYIEKTVPVRYRRYVREGILGWNKAFEKAGLRNAIAVRQQSDQQFADYDPEDVRYNFFRWIVSGRSFAMGPSRANPLTGQILDADIIMDDSMVRVWMARYAQQSAKGPAAEYDPQLEEFLSRNPQWRFIPLEERLLPESTSYAGVDQSWEPELLKKLAQMNPNICTYASGKAHELAFGCAVLEAAGAGDRREEFIGQMIREVVTHEVGHTLGLRHNFKASSWLPLEEIMRNTDADKPTCASVMDYTPAMFAVDAKNQANFIGTSIGPYDEWAIEYGYRVPDKGQNEQEMLKTIAARAAQAGLDYATDEDAGALGPDPLVNLYDNGDDPIKFAKQRMEMVQALQKNITDWAVKDGESYTELRKQFDQLLFEFGRCARFAARLVGGQYVHRDHKGDPDARPPFVMVPAARQREALDFVIDHVLSDRAFTFDPGLLNKLAPGRWRHWDSDTYDSTLEYPVHDRIAATQYWVLFHLTNPFTINRLYDAELKVPAGEEAVTVPELLYRTTKAVWSELTGSLEDRKFTDREPFISSLRRGLQRQHLRIMLNILLSDPGASMPADAHAVVRAALKGLSAQIGDVLEQGTKLDPYTHSHLDECKSRIDKALEAEFKL
jgi:hypothetical protein